MNSTLEQDYDEFKFSRENQLEQVDVEEKLQNYSGSPNLLEEIQRCEICEQKFQTKKDLQTHVLIHLGKPRVVLKRIANLKTARKESNDQYWLEAQQKGNLKITFKRQSPVCDSLKLKLKKSPISEGFTVVSNNLDFDKESYTKQEDELAETHENDSKSDSEEEKTTEQSFENVMLNQENNYDDENDDNFESEPDQNPLENSERPLMDNNEGDSGVGSDFVNPLEREDQNVDDLQTDNNSNSDHAELAENEDPEESDALEATCRETIENLKKLGEQSSSRSSELLNPNETPADDEEEETNNEVDEAEEEEDEEEQEEQTSHTIEELQRNSEISIVPKSALMPEQPVHSSPRSETEILPVGGSGASFSWNKISEESNSSHKSRDSHDAEKENTENADSSSLLQNFLLEQQRNQNESNLSSNAQSLETEYVSLEKLAETVNTCRVCNEKFKDLAHLDSHRSKAGHYQCNVPDCSSLVFTSPLEVSVHKAQAHGAPVSPNVSNVSPHHLSQNSPHSHSPHMNQGSPHLNTHSPHSPSVQSIHQSQSSPITSPHNNSPSSYSSQLPPVYPPVNLEQLPAPVQQLAQQVQRMPLPQVQLPPGAMPPGMIPPGPNYYPQPPGRPPMYRVQAPVHYPPHMAHLYQQYNSNPYQMSMQQQMQSQMSQQIPRGRYPAVVPGQRAPRMSQQPPSPAQQAALQRARLKRPMPPQAVSMQQSTPPKRRMDVLLPDRNEDADCHVIAQQKRNDGLPVIQNVQGGTSVQPTSRSDSTIHLTDSITLSVRQPAQVNAMVQGAKKPDASAVANVLAARGITVTPAANKKSLEQNNQTQQQQQQQQQQQPQAQQQKQVNVSTLNLNSAISIIPASSAQRKQQEPQAQFAVPQNKQSKQVTNEVERPPRPPTVDLTQDTPPLQPIVRRGRPPRMLQSLTCQVCDKRFQSQEILTQHMASHRTTNKLLHKCNLCPAQYPTAAALATHKKTYHKEVDTTLQNNNIELALPVVDLKSPNTLNRLASLGIQSYIPLSQLSAQTGGYFALPIVTIDGARNPNTCNLGALGATSILSLGPLKHLSNR